MWLSAPSNVVLFSVQKELAEGLFLRGRDLVCRANGKEKILTTRDEIFLRGLHNVENVLASLAAGLAGHLALAAWRRRGYSRLRAAYVDAVAEALRNGVADASTALAVGPNS